MFNGEAHEAHDRIYSDTMKQIGMFQLPENNLDHISGFRMIKEQNEITRLKRE